MITYTLLDDPDRDGNFLLEDAAQSFQIRYTGGLVIGQDYLVTLIVEVGLWAYLGLHQ